MLTDLPPFAAWRLVGAWDGFEVMYAEPGRLRGHTSAVEAGTPFAVSYEILVDPGWRTREARIRTDTVTGRRSVVLRSDGDGRWTVDGVPAPHLDGLFDVDVEASACTNTLPLHRLPMATGEVVAAPAVYVTASDPTVRRLDQAYRRLDEHRLDYSSEGGFRAELRFDGSGLVTSYPGIAARAR